MTTPDNPQALDASHRELLRRNIPPLEVFQTIEVVEAFPGKVSFTFDIEENLLNYRGTIHGGIITTLSETAAGMVMCSYNLGNVALTGSTNFIKAVGLGRVSVVAEASHKGRSTVVIHCSMRNEEGKLVSESTYTMFVLK